MIDRIILAAAEGLGEMLLSNLLVGLMYVLLAMCFAELTSIVAFAGGSFGYCRAALGPFWGFMVGASEMFENFLYVVVTVMAIGSACTVVFGVDRMYEPIWYLISYGIITGVHLRGGLLFWHGVIVSGITTMILVFIYCAGGMKHVDIYKWGMPDGTLFKKSPYHFTEAVFFPTWFYIGLEIVPQTCERVKDVNINLPRGMIWASVASLVVSFWLIFAATCNFPGYGDDFASYAFPLQYGFQRAIGAPASFGALVTLVPSFAAAVGFMWGCGYQVASLARSGLLPSICAKTYGENDIPYVNLLVSSVLQYVLCVILWAAAPLDGPRYCYQTVVIGASIVYIGVFTAFIMFRVKFGAMKREWVSVVGIPGALLGISVAALVFTSCVGFQDSQVAIITYFVYMFFAGMYYIFYAQRTQFFSAEEQKKFMKAYILNANKKHRKRGRLPAKPPTYLEKVWADVSKRFSTLVPISQSRTTSRNSSQHTEQSAAITTSPRKNADVPTTLISDHFQMKRNAVAPDNVPAENGESPADLEKGEDEIRHADHTADIKVQSGKEVDTNGGSAESARNSILRSSFGSGRLGLSGKVMTMNESKTFFEMLASNNGNLDDADIGEKLLTALPNQFVVLADEGQASGKGKENVTRDSVDGGILNQTISSDFAVERN